MSFSPEGQRPERIDKALALIEDLGIVYGDQLDQVVTLPSNHNPLIPYARYLAGRLPAANPNNDRRIGIVNWTSGGLQSYSITGGPRPYLIDGSRVVYADAQDELVSDIEMEAVISDLNSPGTSWSIDLSLELVGDQLYLDEMWDRTNDTGP